jgi:hypothetical protein
MWRPLGQALALARAHCAVWASHTCAEGEIGPWVVSLSLSLSRHRGAQGEEGFAGQMELLSRPEQLAGMAGWLMVGSGSNRPQMR